MASTLRDLVSYNEKHNEANGEGNNDGESHNRSWNCGAEGATDDPAIIALRKKQQRNFIATLFLSQGVPMLVAGDEWGRSQKGNNNAYCQDNEISWLNWTAADTDLLDFTHKLIRLQKTHPTFQRRRWFIGQKIHGTGTEDIAWFNPDGGTMKEEHWNTDFAKSLMVFISGLGIRSVNERGARVTDDHFLLLFNAAETDVLFRLPDAKYGTKWTQMVNTAHNGDEQVSFSAGAELQVESRSLIVLTQEVQR